jgi:hypothetical protein
MGKVIVSDNVQLATRIPKRVHREVKLECVTTGVSVQAWVHDALTAHLARCRGTIGDDDAPPRALTTLPKRTRAAG